MPIPKSPMVSVLQNLQISLQVFLSGRFFGAIDPFILLLEGSERPLELVPADFLRYSVEWVIRKFFRVVRSERSSAANDHLPLRNPPQCAAYLESLFSKLAEDLSDHQTRVVEEAYFRMRLTRNPLSKIEVSVSTFTEATPKMAVASVPSSRNDPCANYLGSSLKAVHKDGNPYSCSFGKACKFRHVDAEGKKRKELIELIALTPASARVDLTKALAINGSNKVGTKIATRSEKPLSTGK